MRLKYDCCGLLLALTLTSGFVYHTEVTDYFNLPPTLKYNNRDYNLSWSSHPIETYYKEEFTLKGEKNEHFNDMFMVEFMTGELTAKSAAVAQVFKLINRKQTDIICNYKMTSNADESEFILDFLMSDPPGGSTEILEWNAYHYKQYTDSLGHKGVLLLGVSHRAYGNNAMRFMRTLKDFRNEQLAIFTKYPLPQIQLK